MKVNESTVTVMCNCRIPNPPYYALYKYSSGGYYYQYMRRNLTLEEVCNIAKDIPSKWRAYPRLTRDVHPTPRYYLRCFLPNGREIMYRSTNWKYICRKFDQGINLYSTMIIIDSITGKILVQRDDDGTVTVSNKVTLPKHRPEPRYEVTIYEPGGLRRHSYTHAWKYAKRAFNKAAKAYDKVEVIDLATGEVYMYRDGTDWYFSMSIATLQ